MSILMIIFIIFTLNLVSSVIGKNDGLKQENVEVKNSPSESILKFGEDDKVLKDPRDTITAGETTISGSNYQPIIGGGGGYIPPQIPFDYERLGVLNPYPYFRGLQTFPFQVNSYYPRPSYYQPNYLENYDDQFNRFINF